MPTSFYQLEIIYERKMSLLVIVASQQGGRWFESGLTLNLITHWGRSA